MQLYSVSDEYINYLKSKFPRVYSNKEDTRVHTRKYLGVVIEIGVYKYYIPLSSPKEKHDYIMVDGKKTIRKDSLIVMRIVSGTGENKELKGTLQIGTMIPVPDEVIELYDVDHEPDQAYKDLVNEEIIYIRKHEKVIIKNAKILYSKRKAGEENRVVQNCLDFMAIEAECDKYISNKYQNYWESCWQEEDAEKLQTYLEGWKKYHGREIEILQEYQVKSVCDAACGFGAHTVCFAANGFEVAGFDISPTSVEITKQGLAKCGFPNVEVKVASLLDIGYADASFDAVNVRAVIDHLTMSDAQKAVEESFRIIRKGGLVLISFDSAEEEDFWEEHIEIEPGTMQYVSGERAGMLFHLYEWEEIDRLLEKYEIVEKWTTRKGEQVVVVRK